VTGCSQNPNPNTCPGAIAAEEQTATGVRQVARQRSADRRRYGSEQLINGTRWPTAHHEAAGRCGQLIVP
jgi:hypothetical protein